MLKGNGLPAPAKEDVEAQDPHHGRDPESLSFDCICSQRELTKRTVSDLRENSISSVHEVVSNSCGA